MFSTPLLLFLIGAASLAYFVVRKTFDHDPREPPLAPQSIPIIGHLIGLSRRSFNYCVQLSKQTSAPIFTMPLPGQKMYVVTSPDLIQQVQKQHKVLAFPPIEAKFAHIVCGTSRETNDIVSKNVNGDEGHHGLSMESYDVMRDALHPGPKLDDMNRAMINEMASAIDLLQPAEGEKRTFDIFAWLRDAMTLATTRSVYGPMNPYDDKVIADAFWEYEAGMMLILVNILPSVIARKAIAARDKVAKAFETYYKAGGHEKGSAWARDRYQLAADYDISLEDTARFEVGGSNAVLLNTVPAAFWNLVLIHSDPNLRNEIRQEVDACIRDTIEDGIALKIIDIVTLKEKCPLLLSTYQEVLRYRAVGTSVREVMEDTYLDGYLLKKGAMLQMPTRVIHEDAELWGDTSFVPGRFLPQQAKSLPRGVCFRAFGGGKTLCPGRHFATNEVLGFVAAFIARLDMIPVAGEWRLPAADKTNLATVIMEPDHDIKVQIKTREGFEGVKWSIRLDSSDKIFAIVTEDQAFNQEKTDD
ncbi:putative cytochrome P450 [Myriangium duriaei CBS 260.36]|uniref:Cytochrome P450 n=1 Tax=Myriangium duriaei CBS 260.36 TaxID=1168546 RepID=A0A9P4MK10_9PEZI|nr:putative cytochrome P450 [Myriangium duriaei CBS 260.36]